MRKFTSDLSKLLDDPFGQGGWIPQVLVLQEFPSVADLKSNDWVEGDGVQERPLTIAWCYEGPVADMGYAVVERALSFYFLELPSDLGKGVEVVGKFENVQDLVKEVEPTLCEMNQRGIGLSQVIGREATLKAIPGLHPDGSGLATQISGDAIPENVLICTPRPRELGILGFVHEGDLFSYRLVMHRHRHVKVCLV